jgi:plasmid stability protein
MAIQLTAKASSTKSVMLKLDADLYARIKVAAQQHNMATSAAMREILKQGITEIEANVG